MTGVLLSIFDRNDVNHRFDLFQSIFDRSGENKFRMLSAGMISSAQSRAARGLLDWSQQQLADAAGVGVVTVRQFENDKNSAKPRSSTLQVIKLALISAGVEFIADERCEGVAKLKQASSDG